MFNYQKQMIIKEMDYKEFVDLVGELRQAQRKYFNTRSYSDLAEAKKLEKQVDDALEDINNPKLF